MSELREKLVSHAATVFQVRDVRKISRFYRDQLGFTITFEWGDPLQYVATNRDEAVFISFSQNDSVAADPDDDSATIYIFVHDVDAIYREFQSKQAGITNPIGDRDYGMRDFDLTDPEGNRLTFAKHISND